MKSKKQQPFANDLFQRKLKRSIGFKFFGEPRSMDLDLLAIIIISWAVPRKSPAGTLVSMARSDYNGVLSGSKRRRWKGEVTVWHTDPIVVLDWNTQRLRQSYTSEPRRCPLIMSRRHGRNAFLHARATGDLRPGEYYSSGVHRLCTWHDQVYNYGDRSLKIKNEW